MIPDSQLLGDYVRAKSQDAFTQLVQRHLNLVYSAALRQVRSPQLAEEIAQSVFADLARAAKTLKPDTILTAWLYQVTRRTAIDVVRRESRRQARERLAVEMAAMNTAAEWTHIEPLLDDAMEALDEPDRAAILLRYFENKSLREVGQSLGTSDDAAQKRVSRAIERLREFFSKRGVAIGASGLVVLISANAVHAAPIALAATISTAAVLAGTTAHTSTAIATTKVIAMTTLQKTLVTATLAVVAGTGIYEAHQSSQLRGQIQTLQQQQAPLTAQLQQLQQERDDATNQLASLTDELEKMRSGNLELLRLRSENDRLRQGQTTLPKAADTTLAATDAIAHNDTSQVEAGRELGAAVVRGEPGAFDRLLAESKAEHQYFKTNNYGEDSTNQNEFSLRTFAPINAAFKVIEDAAVRGNSTALDAVSQALQIPELKGSAVHSLGQLAGNGDSGALQILLHPEKYGVPVSGTISPLKPAADNGNQNAIDALAAVAKNPNSQPLWYMTANSLAKAAASGNPVAIDALINMSSTTNRAIQSAVAEALRGAAANQNAQAAEALRSMGQSVPSLGR